MLEKARTIRENLLGPDHPDTLSSCNDLAGAFLDAGRAAEALPLCEATYPNVSVEARTRSQRHAEEPVEPCRGLHKLGRTTDGFALFAEVLEREKSTRGRDHSETLNYRTMLAMNLAAAGRHTEASLISARSTSSASRPRPRPRRDAESRNNLAFALIEAAGSKSRSP